MRITLSFAALAASFLLAGCTEPPQPRGRYVESEPVHVPATAPVQQIIVAGGEYSLNGRPFTVLPGMLWPGTQLRVRVWVPARATAPVTATLHTGTRRTNIHVVIDQDARVPALQHPAP